jgi:hypothetical protein
VDMSASCSKGFVRLTAERVMARGNFARRGVRAQCVRIRSGMGRLVLQTEPRM